MSQISEQIVSRERVFSGVKVAVDRLKVRADDGTVADRELVDHPGAVTVLGVLDDGRIVFIRNERFVVGKTLLELPAGTIDEGEEPIVCAGREMIEETGYEAAEIEPLCSFYTTPGFSNELMHVFVARGLKHVGQRLEPTERITVEPMTMDAALAEAKAGRMDDGKTLASLLYYRAFYADS